MIRRLKSDRGAAAVEFGIVLLALIPLIIGVLEMGRGLSTYITVTTAAREAVRQMTISNSLTNARTAAVNAAYGIPLPSGNVNFPGGGITTCNGNAGQTMRLVVTYTSPSVTNLLFTSIPMSVTGAMRCPG